MDSNGGDVATTNTGSGRRRSRLAVARVGVLSVALVAVGAVAYQRTRGPGGPPDGRAVVAEVSGDCRSLQIRIDGWVFGDQKPFEGPVGAPVGDDPAADPPTTAPTQDFEDGRIPIAWRGERVRGHLEIDRTSPSVLGRFVSDDGTEVAVTGGREGEYFSRLSCAIWPD